MASCSDTDAIIRALVAESADAAEQALFELDNQPNTQNTRARTLLRRAEGLLRDSLVEIDGRDTRAP